MFATYPRFVLSMPIKLVAGGTYDELKGDRLRLSKAFFRTNAFLIRSGFFVGGILALIAPEFIRLILGDKWLPMLDAFRLMLVYTLLDPIKLTVANVLTTSGAPQKVVRARAVQLVVLLIGLASLGPWLGISGIALAVDAMLVVGMAILLWQAKYYVDYSLLALFGVPTIALIAGLGCSYALLALVGIAGSDWLTGAVKLAIFSLIYSGTLFLLEREQFSILVDIVNYLRPGERHAPQDED